MHWLLLRWVRGLRCLIRQLLLRWCWLCGLVGRLVLGCGGLGEGLLDAVVGLGGFFVNRGGVVGWLLVLGRGLLVCDGWDVGLGAAVCGAGVGA